MASVNSSVEVKLTEDEMELLEKAITLIKNINRDVADANSELFVDEVEIFSVLNNMSQHYDGKLPACFEIE